MKTDYERQRDRETRRVLELAKTRQEIHNEASLQNPDAYYIHSLKKREDILERELHTGRYSVN